MQSEILKEKERVQAMLSAESSSVHEYLLRARRAAEEAAACCGFTLRYADEVEKERGGKGKGELICGCLRSCREQGWSIVLCLFQDAFGTGRPASVLHWRGRRKPHQLIRPAAIFFTGSPVAQCFFMDSSPFSTYPCGKVRQIECLVNLICLGYNKICGMNPGRKEGGSGRRAA